MPRYCNVNSSGVLHSKHAQAASPPCRRATLAGRTIGKVCHPQAIRVIGDEVALDQTPWAGRCAIWHRSTHPFATPDALDTKATHQTLHRAAGHRHSFPIQLLPNFPSPIDPKVLLPHALDMHHELFIPLGSLASQLRIPASGGMSPVS